MRVSLKVFVPVLKDEVVLIKIRDGVWHVTPNWYHPAFTFFGAIMHADPSENVLYYLINTHMLNPMNINAAFDLASKPSFFRRINVKIRDIFNRSNTLTCVVCHKTPENKHDIMFTCIALHWCCHSCFKHKTPCLSCNPVEIVSSKLKLLLL